MPVPKRGVGDKSQSFEGGKTVVSRKKQSFEGGKTVVSKKKQSFEEKVNELCLSAHTKGRILQLYRQLGESTIFSRADVMKITGITSSPAGDLIKKMKSENLLQPVAGHGKGRYRFQR